MRTPPILVNGRKCEFWVQPYPPFGEYIPWVQVHMKRHSPLGNVCPGGFYPVAGKVDTGADRTVLRASTGAVLGIADISSGAKEQIKLHTAKIDQTMQGYVHSVFIELRGSPRDMKFSIDAVFSKEVKHDLFGRDWLKYVCIGMDHNSVHFIVG